MAIYGPTPADWAAQQEGRRDDQIRQMMNIIMATKQWQEEQRRYQDTLKQRDFSNALDVAHTNAYVQKLAEPNPVQPTEMMRNWQFLEGQYPGQDIGPMVVPGLRERQTSEYTYDIDPETAAQIESDFRLPQGTVAKMGSRQRADVNQQWLNTRFPRQDTNIPESATAVGGQKAYLNTLLQDYEARRSAHLSAGRSLQSDDPKFWVEQGRQTHQAGLSELDGKIGMIQAALARLAGTRREFSQSEWEDLNKRLSTGGGYSRLAQEIADEMGIPVELAEQYVKKATTGTPTGVRRVE